MVSFFFLSRPYASAAAVGSLMMRITSRPAILPASLVACRWASLKYAGTVITACVTFSPRYASAASLICDDRGLAAFHNGHTRVRRAQVDAYDFAHVASKASLDDSLAGRR